MRPVTTDLGVAACLVEKNKILLVKEGKGPQNGLWGLPKGSVDEGELPQLAVKRELKEECGIFGISNHDDASALTALGLHALQHRGQEGCGIVSFDGKNYHSEKRQGLVGDHFTDSETIKKLPGTFAIGHTRYSTTGETSLRNIQP